MVSGVESRLAATGYQREAVRFAGRYAGYYTELGRLWHSGKMSDTQYVRLCVELERAGHDGSAVMAGKFVSDFRKLNGVDPGLIVYDEFDAAAALARSISTTKILKSDPDKAHDTIDDMAVGFNRAVLNAGRDTVEWSAGAQGRSWRRVTDGDPCAFCAMLATRSDYTTKERALTTGHTRRHKRGSKRPLGSRYHDHCGCTVVEVVGPWELNKADAGYQRTYEKAREWVDDHGLSQSPSNILKAMRTVGGMR
ncbi:head maturation protease [Propionibacterium phage QueenBey]|uniref:head maturation protease n=1 Tax=Propionibacterium phage QueenBey TaxID=1654782 RepID=UPI0007B64766|nr:head maturation protease [Propionibacterium phage QueenBey]AKO60862.1 capsid maturation protease [Propionibacterium phage QueenBey]